MRLRPSTLPRRLHRILHWLTPLGASIVLYGLAYSVCRWVFDVTITGERIPYDFALMVAISYLLFAASRRIWAYLVLLTVLVAVAYIGSAAKITYLGRPIMPDDVYNVSALFRILGPWGWPIVALPLGAIVGLFLFNLRLRGTLRKNGALGAVRAAGQRRRREPDPLPRHGPVLGQHALGSTREFRLARRHRASDAGIAAFCRHAPAAAQTDDVTAAIDRRRAAAGLPSISGSGVQ